MGNQSTSQQQQHYNWQKLYTIKSLPGSPTLVVQKNNLQGQQYQLTSNSIRIAYQRANNNQTYCNKNGCINTVSMRQSQQYEIRRKQTENVVKILNYKFSPSCYDFINDQVNYTIITERIHCRLKDLQGITRKQGFYILYHALKGYNAIANAGKLGYVNSQMIGLTTSADVKVWINSCWAINYPQKPLAAQRQSWMIDEVIYTIEEEVRKTNKKGFGDKFSSHYSLSKKKFNSMIPWLYLFSNYQQNKRSAKQTLKLKILNIYKKQEKKESFDKKILLKAKKIINLDDKFQSSTDIKGISTGNSTKKTTNNHEFLIELHKVKKISITERKNQSERKNKTERIATKIIENRRNSVKQIKRNQSNNSNVQQLQTNAITHQKQTVPQQKPMKICFNFFTPTQYTPKIKYLRKNLFEYAKYPILQATAATVVLPNNSMKNFNYVERKISSKHSLQNQSKQSLISELILSKQNSENTMKSPQKVVVEKEDSTPQFMNKFKPYQLNNQKQKLQESLRFTFSSDNNLKANLLSQCFSRSESQESSEQSPISEQQPTSQTEQPIKTEQILRDFRSCLQAYHPEQQYQSHNISQQCQQNKSLTIIYQSSQIDELH